MQVTKSSVTEHESERPPFDMRSKTAIQNFVKSIQTQKIHVIMFVVC
jgi:hypothetical protein